MLEKACKRGTSDPNNGCEGDQVISFSTEGIEAGLPLHATLLFVLFDKQLFWMTIQVPVCGPKWSGTVLKLCLQVFPNAGNRFWVIVSRFPKHHWGHCKPNTFLHSLFHPKLSFTGIVLRTKHVNMLQSMGLLSTN